MTSGGDAGNFDPVNGTDYLNIGGSGGQPLGNIQDVLGDDDGEADYASNENNAGDASEGDEQMRFLENDIDNDIGDDIGNDLDGYGGVGGEPI